MLLSRWNAARRCMPPGVGRWRPLANDLLESAVGAIHLSGQLSNRLCDNRHERARLVPLPLFDPLTDSWKGLHAVTGVEPRGIDDVLEPLSPRQARFVPEGPL